MFSREIEQLGYVYYTDTSGEIDYKESAYMMMETEKSYVVLSASGRPRIASGRVREGETYRMGSIGLHPGLQA